MSQQTEFSMLIEVSEEVRTALELVKTIIKLQRPGVGAVTWTHAVEWLAYTVPVRDLLAEMLQPQEDAAHKGNSNGRRTSEATG